MLKMSETFRLAGHFDAKFCFNEDVYLVKGAKHSAIYDLLSGEVYSVHDTFGNALDLALTGRTPKEITMQTDNDLYDIIGFLDKLVHQKLGGWYRGPTRPPKSYRDLPPPSWELQFAWLELTDRCNLGCIHCYRDSRPSQLPEKETALSEGFRHVISELAELGCSRIQFTGGEPLLLGDQLLDFISLAEQKGFQVMVFTNLTLLTTRVAKFFKQHNVRVRTSLYAPDEELHDSITTVKGSFARTVRSIRGLVSETVPVMIGIIALRQNEGRIDETIRFAKEELGVDWVKVSEVLQVGRGCTVASDDFMSVDKRPPFSKVSREEFIARLHGHSCLRGKIAIASSGEVLPCPFLRNTVLGNVRQQSLHDIMVSDELKQIWELTKDQIDTCKDCEYRYACFDCRAKAKSLMRKPSDCIYDPYQLPTEPDL
jgi:radical SAM protein with 4Fe4S-binding SPASM domain